VVQGVHELETAVREAMKFEWSEVVRAKKAIREILSDGQPHGVQPIQRCLVEADGIPAEAHGEKMHVPTRDDIAAVVTKDEPIIARNRLMLAASEALLDLMSQGIVIEVARSPIQAEGNPSVSDGLRIGYQLGGLSSAVQVNTALPQLTPAYRLAPRYVQEAAEWFFDVDLFTADIEQLHMDRRTRRCIAEALSAFRQGLFLASASLIGAASEGAWYAAGERLREHDPRLAKHLDNDDTMRVQKLVGELLRQNAGIRASIHELEAQAALLRQLRNYGVHPRSDETDHLERYFSDSGVLLLLMESHTYFTRLADAVEAWLVDQDSE